MKKESKNELIPHNFNLLIKEGLSKGQSEDMMRKHFVKLEYDVKVNQLKNELESVKREVAKTPVVTRYKELRRRFKQLRADQEKATDIYLGSVSTGLVDVMPGKNLSEKLAAINQMAAK